MEIVLRLFSRIFDIGINLYSEKMSILIVDNCIENYRQKEINIYQYALHTYFNIYPDGLSFEPIRSNVDTIVTKSKPKMEVIDI